MKKSILIQEIDLKKSLLCAQYFTDLTKQNTEVL